MLDIIACKECTHDKYCKCQQDFKDELELLLTVRNKFDNLIVTATCHRFNRNGLPNKL